MFKIHKKKDPIASIIGEIFVWLCIGLQISYFDYSVYAESFY